MSLRDVKREFKELPLGLIDDPELPSRSQMDEQKLDELAADIREHGLQQPMIVARVGDRFEVIAGHRRRLACGRAGLVAAPCSIYPTKDAALLAVQFGENYFREDLNAADEAAWFHDLLEGRCGGDVDALCAALHRKRSYVEGRLLLFSGDPIVFDALKDGKIQIGLAHELNKVTDERMRRYYLDAAVRGGATVAVVAGWVMDWKNQERDRSGEPAPAAPAAAPSAVPQLDYFRCACCGKNDNVHLMTPINVHQHCKLAILDPLLAAYHGDPS